MSERSLAYLSEIPVERVKGLAGRRGAALRKGGIDTVADLLLHAPRRYLDRSATVSISDPPTGEEVTVIGTVRKVTIRRIRRGLVIVDAIIEDDTGRLSATWFNQAFRARQLSEGTEVALSGKIERFRGKLQMKSPATDVLGGESLTTGRVVPVHPSVGEVGPGHLRRALHNALERSLPMVDPIPAEIQDRNELCDRDFAFGRIHFPETLAEAEMAARRLIFDEFFRLELALASHKRHRAATEDGVRHDIEGTIVRSFIGRLPYELTGAQRKVLDEIGRDLAGPEPMHRLLQGEVGSGKTVVAVAALLAAVQGGYQGAVMAPTEVLATQHYLGVRDLLQVAEMAPGVEGEGAQLGMDNLFDRRGGVKLALLTSGNVETNFLPGSRREDVLEWIASGKIDLVVGTHSLIQEGVQFGNLGAAVIDEQHRFGVHQRVLLREKAEGHDPDLLIMTATPIPRTLSMTLYGDLDVSIIDEMPPGRKSVETKVVARDSLEDVYTVIRREAAVGNQTFVVCPLVEESDKVEAAAATAEFERLQLVLPELRLALIHGQMPPGDKQRAMEAMRAGEVDVLVATTVIEVGIDISTATVMVIEDAERFGLSQLHQLRGRVGRGSEPAKCFLVASPTTDEGKARIAAMMASSDGFRLAEEDLRIRGQGTIFGSRQAGLGDLKLGDILRDVDLLVAARREAFALVDRDPELDEHPGLGDEIRALLGSDVDWLFIS